MGQDQSKIHRGVKISEVFNVYDVIGKGSYATVFRAQRIEAKESSEDLAIKVVKTAALEDEEKRGLKEEIRLLLEVDHPHIVQLHEVHVSRRETVYLIMELLKGGEMFDRIVDERFFSEANAAYAVVQVLDALAYMHAMGICHRDVKPENLLYCTKDKKSKLVLGDFGLATQKKEMTKCCGTPQYVAPEILNNKPYGCKVDCWSVGIVLYTVLCGYPPFFADTNEKLFKHITSEPCKFVKEDWGHISDEAKDLITKLLAKDPSKRLAASEAKKHPWLVKAEGYGKALGPDYQDRMRRFTHVQRLRAGVTTTLALIRMRDILMEIIDDIETPRPKVVTDKDNNKPKIEFLDKR